MASLNTVHPHNPKKPGLWLGFFIAVTIASAILVVFGEYPWKPVANDTRWFKFDGGNWLAFFAGLTALLGALSSSWINLHNAIKQHTINTLLQMRMSETYMARVERLNKRYGAGAAIYFISKQECETNPPEACFGDMIFVLNYLEFIASAIRAGDLNEKLMYDSLRGMVCNNFEVARELIKHRRHAAVGGYNEKLFEHLEWLQRRWYVERLSRPLKARVPEDGSVLRYKMVQLSESVRRSSR